jgi:hypothetical protein
MIDTSELVSDLVETLRDIEDLVTAVGGDDDVIFCYLDAFPSTVSLAHAVHTMPTPGIMVAWQGTVPASFGGMDVWKHHLTLFVRATAAATYGSIFRLVTKGTPATDNPGNVPMSNYTVHENCYPMDLPLIERRTDAEGLDYFEIPLSFTEIGDN